MTGFIRPEARAALWRWREVLIGAFLVFVGSWWVFGPGQLIGVIGWIVGGVGTALVFMGLQRGRFRGKRDAGPGSVDIDEGQVTYFGPMTGGAVALRDVSELALLKTGITTHWRLTAEGNPLYIPVNAAGADALFDAFTTLPGLKVERMLTALKDTQTHDTVIWSRAPVRDPSGALH